MSAKNKPNNKERNMRFVSCRPQGALNQFLDDNFLSELVKNQYWTPDLDIVEDKDQYVLKADLPGLKKENIKISVENDILTIEGERQSETVTEDKKVHRVERSYGRFTRSVKLGVQVDTTKIKASYKDGVLELIVPKAENKKPQSIDVQVE
jgi:HSP20 family protein